jgi:hypothetical protein
VSWLTDTEETLTNLCALRKELSLSPKPSYNVHGHQFSWTEYMRYLGDEIDRIRKELAQVVPVEEVGRGI